MFLAHALQQYLQSESALWNMSFLTQIGFNVLY
jgi:hypothetical protein